MNANRAEIGKSRLELPISQNLLTESEQHLLDLAGSHSFRGSVNCTGLSVCRGSHVTLEVVPVVGGVNRGCVAGTRQGVRNGFPSEAEILDGTGLH